MIGWDQGVIGVIAAPFLAVAVVAVAMTCVYMLCVLLGSRAPTAPPQAVVVNSAPIRRLDDLRPPIGLTLDQPYARIPGVRLESSETVVVGSFEFASPFWEHEIAPDYRDGGPFRAGYISLHEAVMVESLWLEAVLSDAVPLVATKPAADALAAEPIDVERLEHSWDEEGLEAYAKARPLAEQLPQGETIAAGFREIVEARLAPTLKIKMGVNGRRCFESATPFTPSTAGPVPVGPGESVEFRVRRAVQAIAPPAVPVSRLILKARITRRRPAG